MMNIKLYEIADDFILSEGCKVLEVVVATGRCCAENAGGRTTAMSRKPTVQLEYISLFNRPECAMKGH
jgi:hypothetical protein